MKGRDNKSIDQHLDDFLKNEFKLYESILDSKAAYAFNQIVIAALSTDPPDAETPASRSTLPAPPM